MDYWLKFYKTLGTQLQTPSRFCAWVSDYFKDDAHTMTVLDAGCGNGRDAYGLAQHFKSVHGVDSCGYVPENAGTVCTFEKGDFCTHPKDGVDLVYSRFTFHSITNAQHEEFLSSVPKWLCIETRSDKDTRPHVHGEDHYRNPTNAEYLKKLLEKHDFEVKFFVECDDFAPYKDENPVCIRVVALKKCQ